MDILYIVVPAYNEEMNIEKLVRDWYPVILAHDGGGSSRMVVVNDGSTDATWETLNMLAADYPLLIPVTKPNGGHGSAVIFGYRYALESGADYIFQTDSDGQTDPSEFAAFWKRRGKYDAILGNRTVRGDGRSRAFVERVVCMLLFLYFGVKVPDANAPFRLMKTSVVAEYLDRFPEDYNIPNIMLTAFFAYDHVKLAFREISFRPRQGGTNSLNIKGIAKIGWGALGDFAGFKKDMRDRSTRDK